MKTNPTRKSAAKGTTILKLPHLDYIVVIERKKKDDLKDAGGYTKYMHAGESMICLPLPIRGKKSASIAVHEIIHVLQNICEGSNMKFLNEREHMAYIADWLFDEICKI